MRVPKYAAHLNSGIPLSFYAVDNGVEKRKLGDDSGEASLGSIQHTFR
jgi:hypothetical protein